MREKIIYYGDINNNQKDVLIEKSKEFIKNNNCDKFYYILPSGNLLNAYREKLLVDIKGAFGLNVITFDDVVNELINQYSYRKIDDSVKETIIASIVRKLLKNGKIHYYKDQKDNESFIKSLSYIIGEIKRSLVTVKNLKSGVKNHIKYNEIWNIYEEYQKFLKGNNLLDNEEVYMKAFENMKDCLEIFKTLDTIIIDEFFDFRPLELYLIEELSKIDINIYINIPYKFKKNYITVNETIEKLKQFDFSVVNIRNNNMNYFEKLSYTLFTEDKEKNEKTNKIKLIKAQNIELEVNRIVDDIKSLVNKGVSLNKIGIIANDVNMYKDIIYEELHKRKLPCSIDKTKKMIDIPIAKNILNLLKIRISNYNMKYIIKLIKSNYLNINLELDEDIVENILYEIYNKYSDINIVVALEREINYLENKLEITDNEKYIENLRNINSIKNVVGNIIKDTSDVPKKSFIEDIIKSIKKLLFKYDFIENIEKLYEVHNDEEIYFRDIKFANALNTIFDKLKFTVDISIKDEVNIIEVYHILLRLLSDEEIIVYPGNKNGIKIITPSMARGLFFEKVYIIGVREGQYPKLLKNNWFFNDKNRELFKNQGIVFKNYKEIYDKESLMFALSVSKGSTGLVLSYSDDFETDSSIPSSFVDELLNKFVGNRIEDKIEYEEINMNYLLKDDLMEVFTYSDFLRSIMFKHYKGEDILDFSNMYNSIDNISIRDIQRSIAVEEKRYSEEFYEFDGKLKDPKVIDKVGQVTDEIFSITQLETYGECPMKYYFKYILNIDSNEKEVIDFTNIDKGNIYHKVLSDFYSIYKKDIYDYIEGKIEEIIKLKNNIHNIIIRIIQNEMRIKDIEGIWKLRIEFMEKTIIDLVLKDIYKLKEKVFYPYDFESKFGYNEDFQIETKDFNIKLLGKIDRIDIKENEAIIYDYKTSNAKRLKDILEGTSLQLPVYLMVLKSKGFNPIAGGYIIIKNGEYSYPMVKEKYNYLLEEKKTLSEEEWEKVIDTTKDKINRYVKGIKEGDFRLQPTNCSPYCPYKDICRYNKKRIEQKERIKDAYIESAESC
ncbi:PD-(D/E)XK nuclease family protein [Clostridium sp. D2Q-14]|uniref:PD-(D/E)XK nuclease family protein n=1 Tax=Anaeromonas gelatinilytica TaxID=2683194 RepID=UPI00193C45C5|nr:PD-(D/E)XK nuclease family protein [Anaeromonas gelatinilytica]MBS4536751.1 PD-(D/E)XK nuclease family protein [Anaeromonas gelatinilytica]